MPVVKRPAAAPVVAEVAPVLVVVSNCVALEAACGQRYREEVSDKGLGLVCYDMRRRLIAWGFDASAVVCRLWLEKYQLGHGAKDGGNGIFELSR